MTKKYWMVVRTFGTRKLVETSVPTTYEDALEQVIAYNRSLTDVTWDSPHADVEECPEEIQKSE